MKHLLKTALITSLFSLTTFSAALCATTATIKSEVIVTAEIVTLGDLIENAGAVASTPVFRAPDLGTKGNVSTWRIEEAARKAGIYDLDTKSLASISVEHIARPVRADHVHDSIQEAVAEKMKVLNINTIAITFDPNTPTFAVENSSRAEPTIARIDWNPNTSRFEAYVVIADSRTSAASPMVFRGSAVEMVDVPRLTRTLNKGANITMDDFVIESMPRTKLVADSITDIKQLVSLSAKRQIPAGQTLRMADLERARKIARQDMVTIMFEGGGITLSTRGRALADGALGDVVAVQNTQTKKILEGRVIGAGVVAIQPAFGMGRTKTASILR